MRRLLVFLFLSAALGAEYDQTPEVTLKLAGNADALAVPTQAVKTLGDGQRQVVVVSSTGLVDIRKVRTGLESATKVQVVDGLKEGELVVVGSHSQLLTGTQVKAKLERPGGSN